MVKAYDVIVKVEVRQNFEEDSFKKKSFWPQSWMKSLLTSMGLISSSDGEKDDSGTNIT